MRVVIDCNTLVSSVLKANTVPDRVVQFVLNEHEIVLSDMVFSEIDEVLHRPKFRKYISEPIARKFLVRLKGASSFFDPVEKIVACRDPKDDMYLELAVAGKADCIITGDKALKDLHPFRGIPILTAAEFMEQFM